MARVLADFDTGHCGVVHDAQLDYFGQCLATASADGHIRLWDVREPKEPSLLTDLGGHVGAVYQVCWAPPGVGVLLASVGADGHVLIWGRRATPGEWQTVHDEGLQRHGSVHAVAWAPQERGAVLACASSDGTATVLAHAGAVSSGQGEGRVAQHRWNAQNFQAHEGQASAVSWAMPRGPPNRPLGLDGARFATAGDNGVRVWAWDAHRSLWEAEAMYAPANAQVATRDVAWKAWDGIREMLASATQQVVVIWLYDTAEGDSCGRWHPAQRVCIGEEVWKLSWTEMGNMILLSCGEEEPHTILMKQQLGGEWDVMDIAEKGG